MNTAEALEKMVAPGQPRPGAAWGRDGIIQVHVTRACDRACFHCTQGSNLRGKPVMITPEDFRTAVRSLEGYWGVVGMFGGNPAIHPQFEKLCEILLDHFPQEQLGIWCNHPLGKGKIMRRTFNAEISNLNVHTNMDAWDEFVRDWPESKRRLKGEHESRHSPVLVAMKDVETLPHPTKEGVRVKNTESNRWELISRCDINQNWSAMVCYVPGKGVRGFFCEVAGMMAMMYADNPKYKDLGVPANPGWWRLPMESFKKQAKFFCHQCGVPLKIEGQLEQSGDAEMVSETHQGICRPKDNRPVELFQIETGNFYRKNQKVTNYLENGMQK